MNIENCENLNVSFTYCMHGVKYINDFLELLVLINNKFQS